MRAPLAFRFDIGYLRCPRSRRLNFARELFFWSEDYRVRRMLAARIGVGTAVGT